MPHPQNATAIRLNGIRQISWAISTGNHELAKATLVFLPEVASLIKITKNQVTVRSPETLDKLACEINLAATKTEAKEAETISP